MKKCVFIDTLLYEISYLIEDTTILDMWEDHIHSTHTLLILMWLDLKFPRNHNMFIWNSAVAGHAESISTNTIKLIDSKLLIC
jgi:hypothetical protein